MTFTFRCKPLGLALLVMVSSWHTPLLAASTDLSDVPLPVVSSVAPNIMLMLDTSGSMSNIVPDTPYDSSVTYLSSCPTVLPGGASSIDLLNGADTFDIAIKTDGTARLKVSGAGSGNTGQGFGTGAGQVCFDTSLHYNARLNADSTSTSNSVSTCGSGGTPCNYPASGYLDAVYTGNFLNWYFCTGAAPACNSAANFGIDAHRKSGTSTRMEIARNSAKTIVDSLDKVRVGLSRYNSATSGAGGELAVGVGDNSSTQKSALKAAIDTFTPTGNTPLAETLSGIGAYFAKGATNLKLHPGKSGQTPAYLNESTVSAATVFSGDGASLRNSSSAPAPIQFYCQKSFAVLMTDGRPQGDQSISSSLCDYLGGIGSCPTSGANAYGKKVAPNGTGDFVGYHVNGANKQLHLGGGHSYESAGSDYLDDVAAALYEIDLRPDLTKPSGSGAKNNVFTYTIGFADEQAINDPLLQEAAAAGGGIFLTAANSSELVSAFTKASDDILAKDGSAAAVAVANAHVTNTDNAAYATSYNSGSWSGDLVAYPINTTTGEPNINAPIWNTGCTNPTAYVDAADTSKGILGCSAQVLLDLKTSATRKIFTNNDSSACFYNCGIPFQPTTASGGKLSTAQQALLNTPALTDGAAVVSYLRGDKSGESGTSPAYRSRAHLFGDTVNAEPLVIREPDRNYLDLGYDTFRSSNANRARVILQASNDGMVHAIHSLTGQEEWAYVPNLLISNAKDPNNGSTSLLNTRSRKSNFIHYFLLDGTPVAGDVDFNNSGTTGNTTTSWGTIAVGGLGKGGRGYYALDLTTTIATDEAGAAEKALWEFPRSITDSTKRASALLNMGYSYGKPIIVKTVAAGWVVLVTSGYNNGTNAGDSGGDGLGHLYVLNARTGDLIADLATTGCHATPTTNPCGLASVNAYVENRDINNTMEIAYGGDLYGNLYRFDLRGGTVAEWSVSKLAKLRSGSGASDPVQPITTVPELSKIIVSGVSKYFVYVGTGMYFGKSDLPCPPSPASCSWTPNSQSTQTQTMYGLVDPRDGTTLPDPLLGNLIAQTYVESGNTRTYTSNTLNFSTKKGWYTNFTAGERLVTDPALASGMLVFTSNIPSTTACVPGGSSWLFALDYQTGGQVADASFGGTFLGNAMASRPVLIQLPDGSMRAIIRLTDTTTKSKILPSTATATAGRRVSWREVIDK